MWSPWKFIVCFFITTSIPFLIFYSPASTLSVSRKVCSFLISGVSSLSWLLIRGSAYLLVFLIKACRVAARGLHFGLCRAADSLRSLAGSLLYKSLKTAASAASALGYHMRELSPKIASRIRIVFDALMAQAKVWIKGLLKIVPEIIRSIADMVLKLLAGLWDSYLEAVKYVTGKGSN